MKVMLFLSLLALALVALPAGRAQAPITDIVLGSCLKQVDHPMLDRTLTLPMDLFLFLGDNIYADTRDMAVMRAKYDALKASRFFQELRRRGPVLATWDDHDFGANDVGAEYPLRRESQAEFLRWLDEPADSRGGGGMGCTTPASLVPPADGCR